jgi:hypothetical protein
MTSVPQLQRSQRATLDALLAGLRSAFGGDLFALYVYGAITFAETEGIVDLDYHAILERSPAALQVAEYEAARARLGSEHAPWGADLDGWVILRSQAGGSASPAHVIAGIPDSSWALHRAHWLAGRCIVLWGPPPAEVVTPPSWAEVEADLRGELEFAHRSPHDAFAVLNACRVLHSSRVSDAVQSKFGSAAWALRDLPAEHHAAIRAALATYRGHAAEADARALTRGRAPLFGLVDSELARMHGE